MKRPLLASHHSDEPFSRRKELSWAILLTLIGALGFKLQSAAYNLAVFLFILLDLVEAFNLFNSRLRERLAVRECNEHEQEQKRTTNC